jgi:hypothetical protein
LPCPATPVPPGPLTGIPPPPEPPFPGLLPIRVPLPPPYAINVSTKLFEPGFPVPPAIPPAPTLTE